MVGGGGGRRREGVGWGGGGVWRSTETPRPQNFEFDKFFYTVFTLINIRSPYSLPLYF